MHLFIHSVAQAVIRRLNHPKSYGGRFTRTQSLRARSRPTLTIHDEEDAEQTCALVLVRLGISPDTQSAVNATEAISRMCPLFAGSRCETGSYQAAALTMCMTRWKAVFRSVRRALRIDRAVREDATDFGVEPEMLVEVEHPELSVERRGRLARQARYARGLLYAARASDASRQRRATFRRHHSTLRAFTAIWSGHFTSHPLCEGTDESALRQVIFRFRKYLDRGEDFLTGQALANIPKGPRERELRAFTLIPENFAVAE